MLTGITLGACTTSANQPSSTLSQQQKAEQLIDAFYSFEGPKLQALMSSAQSSQPNVLFYQGWAQGGHYKIVKRDPCVVSAVDEVRCNIQVQDDLMLALKVDFNVTDTFIIRFSEERIVNVDTDSNDLPVFWQAREWVKQHRSELIAIPCKGIWNGGPTPKQCVQAMVEGYRQFAASPEYPDEIVIPQ